MENYKKLKLRTMKIEYRKKVKKKMKRAKGKTK